MRLRMAMAFVGVTLMMGVSLGAHHSNVTFYFMDQTIEITGVVKELRVINPHGRLLIDVTDANGETATWTVDAPNATGMRNRGWTVDSVSPGEVVTVVGSPARNPAAHGIYGRTVTKADGTALQLGAGGND